MNRGDEIKAFGWTAKPRDPKIFLEGKKYLNEPVLQTVDSIKLPDTALAKEIFDYAKRELNARTFNHSMRVYYYGKAMHTQQFPDWEFTDETFFLTCLLHDIGTTDKNISKTLMSFEFFGGFLAHDLLHRQHQAPLEQANSVSESIIRHQDISDVGNITTVGLLIQLATIFDNMGGYGDLVHKETILDVTKHYPRNGWSSCFAATIRKENGLKPWAHTTALGEEGFPNNVLNNTLMAPYDN